MNLDEINRRLAESDSTIASIEAAAKNSTANGPAPWWSVTNAMSISAVVLLFGLLIILLATYLIKSGKRTEDVLRVFGTILIVVMAVFLVVAGYTDTQIAPVMGLLGTIVGYLLGKDPKNHEP